MIKKILLILFLCTASVRAFAERENYIILFDCTASMKGSDGGPVVWEDAKAILSDAILSINGDEAKVVVIPFQDTIGRVTEFYASDKSKTSIVNQILKDVDAMICTRHSGTSICRAWDLGLRYLEADSFNFMLLLTDGADNMDLSTRPPTPAKLDKKGQPVTPDDEAILERCTEEVCKRIRKWCDFGPSKIMSYSRLTQGAYVARIADAAKNCENIVETDGLNISMLSTREYVFNISDFKSVEELRVPLKLNNSLSGRASVKCDSDLFDLTLSKNGFINGEATLTIKPKVDYVELRENIGERSFVHAKVESDDVRELDILLNNLTLDVIGSPEKVLSVNVEHTNLGRADYYRKFLWKKASDPDTLYAKLSFDFNEYAEAACSTVRFDLSSNDGDYCEFFVDGENTSSFIVNSDSEMTVSVIFKPESPEGYYGIQIASGEAGVDRIGNSSVENGEVWQALVYGKYRIRTNPLKITLISILLLVVGLFCLWIFVLRYIFFPRFRISLVSVGKKGQTMIPRRAKGFIKFVITNSPRRQSGFMDLLTGKVQYFVMQEADGITEDIEIVPFDKNSVKICKSQKGTYTVTLSRLRIKIVGQPSEISEVINRQNNNSIKIQIQ